MNPRTALSLSPSLVTGLFLMVPPFAEAKTYSVEIWLIDLPAGVLTGTPSSLPDPGRLDLSPVDADAWLASFGGPEGVSTHLLLELEDAEHFDIELPCLGCSFHGRGVLESGAVRFDLVSMDNPERPGFGCAISSPEACAPVFPGKAVIRESRLRMENLQTLVFRPVDRADGRDRLVLWRSVAP